VIIAVGVFFMIAGAIVAGFSYSVAQFIGARVLLGVGTIAAREHFDQRFDICVVADHRQRSELSPSSLNWPTLACATLLEVSS
jgi:MFS family permease